MRLITLHLRLFFRWLVYYWRARTIYDLQAPFLYDFALHVLEDRRHFYVFSQVAVLRRQLSNETREIQVTDLGAGSLVRPAVRRSIASLARYSAVSPALGAALFRIVHRYKPARMLELGASLGISAIYQSAACRTCHLTTVEGCPATAREAQRHLQYLQANNVSLLNTSFSQALDQFLNDSAPLDYLYLDGDHREGASMQYFRRCLEQAHNDSIFVVADIHWSAAMQRAWRQMIRHPRVRASVDLFHCGVLFFRREIRRPQHLCLAPARWKPWRLGLL